MGRRAANTTSVRKSRSAMSPEARQQQMVSLAIDCAEQQLRDGTASSQVITHYLKLGTESARLENTLKEEQIRNLQAKTEAYQSMKGLEELYSNAIKALRKYQGVQDDDIDVEDDYNEG